MGVPTVPAEILLQTEDASGNYTCKAYTGVPAARPSQICISSSGSTTGRTEAANLAAELEAVLLGSSPEAAVKPVSCPTAPNQMSPSSDPDRRKLLVLLAAADGPLQGLNWYDNWNSDQFNSFVMTVMPPGNFDDLVAKSVPKNHLLRKINVARWHNHVREVLPAVLARAEVTSTVSRIFISYRRAETLSVALQLFDRLTHEGFEVFLDRFSLPPGYDFQRRLDQELEDKSMVVVLESKYIRDSEWTQHEIDFAKRHRLGIATLRMPDVDPSQALVSTTYGPCLLLTPNDFGTAPGLVPRPAPFSGKMNEWQRLSDSPGGALERSVTMIKTAHADALFRRRHRLRADLVAALLSEGLRADYRALGPLVVGNGPDEHLVWPTTRPPDIDDFRLVYGAHAAHGGTTASRGLLVGPQEAQEPDRRQRLDWLQTLSKCLSFDEGDLRGFARRIKTGQWL
jgi:hypothetical protein